MKNFKSLAANKLGGAVRHIGIILCLCLCVFAISAQAQNIKLDNAAVLKMKAAGLDDATIVKAIESSPGAYNTSPDGLISLKTGGAGPDVLNAILNHANGAASSDAKQIGKKQDGLPEELGIYYLKGDKYFSIEPEIMNVRTTNSLATAYSMGAKALKVNGWVTGQHSKTQLTSDVHAFFLNIPEGVAPAEYTLVRLHEKGNRREIELGKARFSMKTGVPQDATIPFQSEKVDKGKYRVSVSGLSVGDYALMPPGSEVSRNSTSVGKVYTFFVKE